VSFELPAGATLVSGDAALPLRTERAPDGTLRVLAGGDGADLTARLRGGRLGALLRLRDDTIPARLSELDAIASDLTTRVNALTSAARDLQGAAGGALFIPNPPASAGSAATIGVAPALLQDPTLLAVSASGAPGDGSVAAGIANVIGQPSAALGGKSPEAFLADARAALGHEIAGADTARFVARDLVDGLTVRRDSVSAVSLDEEAIELIRNQRAFEAAARFIQVLDEITQTAVGLAGR
jgi:flagellar hook-associated protein 1 FlgK